MLLIHSNKGASSSYPSMYSLIDLEHLSNHHKLHPNEAHNLNNPNCVAEIRHFEDMNSELMESLANNPDKMRKEGKKSQSIIGPPIFPLTETSILKTVVPGYLHIVSGIFFKLESEYRRELSRLDQASEEHIVNLEILKDNIINLTQSETDLYKKKASLANEWMDCKDIITAFQSSDTNKNRPCDASTCRLTLTKNISWIECESGKHDKEEFWLHGMCEGKISYLSHHIYYKQLFANIKMYNIRFKKLGLIK